LRALSIIIDDIATGVDDAGSLLADVLTRKETEIAQAMAAV
jgi:hypothetical protein